MATPPDFRDLQRKVNSSFIGFSSYKNLVAKGKGAEIGRGNFPPTPSITQTPTITPTITPTPTLTPSITPTYTVTPTITPTVTVTITPTQTVTPTITNAPQASWEWNCRSRFPTGQLTNYAYKGLKITTYDDAGTETLYWDGDESYAPLNGLNFMQIYVNGNLKMLVQFGLGRSGDAFAFSLAPGGPYFYYEFATATYQFNTSNYPPQPV